MPGCLRVVGCCYRRRCYHSGIGLTGESVRARWSCRKPEEGIQWRVEWIFVAENARLINTRYQLLVESDVDYMQTSFAHVYCDGG